jgi:hypothetical protein
MRVFSYIVARDFGFAPNPFYGFCTLATCKPKIRAGASPGDWVIGTGARTKYGLDGHLLYAMRVEECITFEKYWVDRRFRCKRPILNGSLKQMYGDNIYSYSRGKDRWIQQDSHHSRVGGRRNRENVERDTSSNRVLVSSDFLYFGARAQRIPKAFRRFGSAREDVCCVAQGHKILSPRLAVAFVSWIRARKGRGLCGYPLEFERARLRIAHSTSPSHPKRSSAEGRRRDSLGRGNRRR